MNTDERNAQEIDQLIARRQKQASEPFNKVEPFMGPDGSAVMEVETNTRFPEQVGKLWTGNAWLTVEGARDLRAWLDEAIPRSEPLDPRRGEEPIAENE